MKTLVLGDVHGRTIWKDIVELENPDLTIFLGDYVSSHEGISAQQQIDNLLEILQYKEDNPDKVILLRGNHDIQHLGYYWAECSGLVKKVLNKMSRMRIRFLDDTQWIYIYDKIIFSHAGISQVWMDQSLMPYLVHIIGSQYDGDTIDGEILLNQINNIEPCEIFGFIPDSMFDNYGQSVTQPPIWIRPLSLKKSAVKGYVQVIGHTPVKGIIDFKTSEDDCSIWLCDCLEYKQYLTIEDNEFSIHTLNS